MGLGLDWTRLGFGLGVSEVEKIPQKVENKKQSPKERASGVCFLFVFLVFGILANVPQEQSNEDDFIKHLTWLVCAQM